ncbi:MAG TPA: hypothetical protein VJ948_04105, partial [Acidimicrobiia bacterium]|nr:hypothetical protein [Acidimicrobiia bacterium]
GEQEQITLQEKLREVLGNGPAATLLSMLPRSDELATKADLMEVRDELRTEIGELRTELRTEMGELRTEMGELRTEVGGLRTEVGGLRTELGTEVAFLRQEMALKYATKDDLMELKAGFDANFHSYVRTFTATQAATVVGVSGIVFALTRLT